MVMRTAGGIPGSVLIRAASGHRVPKVLKEQGARRDRHFLEFFQKSKASCHPLLPRLQTAAPVQHRSTCSGAKRVPGESSSGGEEPEGTTS